jgi:hypothetical protein
LDIIRTRALGHSPLWSVNVPEKPPVQLTAKGLEKLKEELRYLTQERRQELSDYMGAALADGDIRESAALDVIRYLLDKGGFVAKPDGTFAVEFTKIKQAVRDLDRDLLTLEATGDYAGAKKMLTELAVLRPEVKSAIEKLADIPTDIEPNFVTAEKLAPAK